MAMRRVWVDAWQLQCCGEPFDIGSTVTWTTRRAIDRAFLDGVLGADVVDTITDWEEHHGGDDEAVELHDLHGAVRSIDAVFCRYTPPDGERISMPIDGSGQLEPRTSADGWEHDIDPEVPAAESTLDHDFIGYLVDIDVR